MNSTIQKHKNLIQEKGLIFGKLMLTAIFMSRIGVQDFKIVITEVIQKISHIAQK
ncbi:hypothetical protein VCRA2119O147_4600002 [Vibrio crassostreae]|nr:hypothetical protein VCRA2113O138_190069 [Vibrio crassostreae]CAK1825956.1 hypothetical protein VCRA2113O140_190069 [Vibrio crassostreae]CAK1869598.1 hypothetical protein VCRA2110O135_10371 [Vibrio crassostreae]CAK1912459.1 hypothetical protein VCRA2113O137_220066 [Vibrio crassostreae]CAK2210271.1 hypothetical protein VCRA2118O144_60028 [Vibrio crassostreae]